jgi:hypothetical protein
VILLSIISNSETSTCTGTYPTTDKFILASLVLEATSLESPTFLVSPTTGTFIIQAFQTSSLNSYWAKYQEDGTFVWSKRQANRKIDPSIFTASQYGLMKWGYTPESFFYTASAGTNAETGIGEITVMKMSTVDGSILFGTLIAGMDSFADLVSNIDDSKIYIASSNIQAV